MTKTTKKDMLKLQSPERDAQVFVVQESNLGAGNRVGGVSLLELFKEPTVNKCSAEQQSDKAGKEIATTNQTVMESENIITSICIDGLPKMNIRTTMVRMNDRAKKVSRNHAKLKSHRIKQKWVDAIWRRKERNPRFMCIPGSGCRKCLFAEEVRLRGTNF